MQITCIPSWAYKILRYFSVLMLAGFVLPIVMLFTQQATRLHPVGIVCLILMYLMPRFYHWISPKSTVTITPGSLFIGEWADEFTAEDITVMTLQIRGWKGEKGFGRFSFIPSTGFDNTLILKARGRKLTTPFFLGSPDEERDFVTLLDRYYPVTIKRSA